MQMVLRGVSLGRLDLHSVVTVFGSGVKVDGLLGVDLSLLSVVISDLLVVVPI